MAENLSLVAQLLIDRTKALVAIQELHKPESHVCECGENHGPYCEHCQVEYPCATRRLADDVLTARTTKNGDNK